MIKRFKFLSNNDNKDIPTPQEIRNSAWLSGIYRQGWNVAMSGGDFSPPPEYRISRRTLNAWCAGYRDSQYRG